MTRSLYWVICFGCVATALLSYRFVFLGFDGAFGAVNVMAALLENQRAVFIAHVTAAPIGLVLGCFQFHKGLRTRFPAFHRWSGRLYAVAILVAGLSGLTLGIVIAPERPFTGSGFAVLSVVWLVLVTGGVRAAREGRFDRHCLWMIYTFALTASSVTLRLQLLVAGLFGYDYEAASGFLAWTCWPINLGIAYLYLMLRQTTSANKGPAVEQAPRRLFTS